MENEKSIKKYSIKELRRICQASAPNPARESKVGLFSRVFSIYFTKLFLPTKITPNQITAVSVLVYLGGVSLFAFNNYAIGIVGSLIVFFSIVLDGCDGEVARFRKSAGGWGGSYVEPVSHDIQYSFIFLILGTVLVYHDYSPYYLLAGAIASVAKLLYRLLETRFWMKKNFSISNEEVERIKTNYKQKSMFIRMFYWINKNFFSSTGIFLMLFICAIMNRIDLYILFFAIGYGLLWLALFAKQVRHIINDK